jgi:hypothetical protein
MADNTLAENEFAEAIAIIGYADKTKVCLYDKVYPDMRARFTMLLIEKWGMVLARPDGDDSAGRAKIRPADPDEVVKHAVNVSAATFAAFKDRGWLLEIGATDRLHEMAKETN